MSDDCYAWLTIFVLPINSATNPILYSLSIFAFRKKVIKAVATSSHSFDVTHVLSSQWRHKTKSKVYKIMILMSDCHLSRVTTCRNQEASSVSPVIYEQRQEWKQVQHADRITQCQQLSPTHHTGCLSHA